MIQSTFNVNAMTVADPVGGAGAPPPPPNKKIKNKINN